MDGNIAPPRLEYFADDGRFPNSALPVLIYAAALAPEVVSAEAMEALFEAGGWPPAWRSSVFAYHHYHSTAHECLGVAAGAARLMLGGPQGREVAVASGDVVVLPAGVAHQRLQSQADFLVVGAYPPVQSWDLLRGVPGERPQADRNIAAVPLPQTDPVHGPAGPLPRLWAQPSG